MLRQAQQNGKSQTISIPIRSSGALSKDSDGFSATEIGGIAANHNGSNANPVILRPRA